MLKHLKITLLILFPIFCFSQKQYSFENIQLNNPYLFYEDKREEQEIILSLIDAYFSKNLSFQEKATFWENTENVYHLKGRDLFSIENKTKGENYTPTILSMLYIDEKYQIRIAWIDNTPEEHKILAIYNFVVNKNYRFENVFDNQHHTLKKKTVKGLAFFFHDKQLFSKKDAKKALKFNKQMADFFDFPQIKFSHYIFKGYQEMKRLRGFDFDTDMIIGGKYGGETFLKQKDIFSGNGSAFYAHEIVHLYTFEKTETKNRFMDEGIATYFGGAQGLHFSELMQYLYPFLQHENINIYTMLDQWEFPIINTKVDSYYAFAALLCHTILEHHGKEKLFELLDSSNDNWEEFLCKIEETFNIHPADYQSFFFRELDLYIKKNFSI